MEQEAETMLSRRPPEKSRASKAHMAESLRVDLEAQLEAMESLNAFVAAAHLQASLDALCRQFGIGQDKSETE